MFRVGNFSDMIYCMKKFVLIDGNFSQQTIGIKVYDSLLGAGLNLAPVIKGVVLGAIIIGLVILMHSNYWTEKVSGLLTTDWTKFFSSVQSKYWILYLIVMGFILLCFTPSASPEFIYYQF